MKSPTALPKDFKDHYPNTKVDPLADTTFDLCGRVDGMRRRRSRESGGFTLVEAAVSMSIAVVGFLGAWSMALQAGKMVSASEEETLVSAALEQRIDQLRALGWPELTGSAGLGGAVMAVPLATAAGLEIIDETITLSPFNLATASTLTATRTGGDPATSYSEAQPMAQQTSPGDDVMRTQNLSSGDDGGGGGIGSPVNYGGSGGAPWAVSFTGGPQALSDARAVEAVVTLRWTGRRSARPHARSLVTLISRGGISKSEQP